MQIQILSPVLAALAAALFFGSSTPFAKVLVGQISPLLLAGLLYAGSGMGLIATRLIKDRSWRHSGLAKGDWVWLTAAIVFGGILGPTLLMFGLQQTSAATTSLLLNLEAVLTALLAWIIFKENTTQRIVLGMLLIIAGGIVLSWPNAKSVEQTVSGPIFIAGACLCWAIDNNLTRQVSAGDPLFIAGSKGFVSGVVNISVALFLGANLPFWLPTSYALLVGFIGYGASLVLFVLALRGLGTARTGAYFSTAPFIGAAIAILFLHETAYLSFWVAAVLMGLGLWLHLTEHHEHKHIHKPLAHNHSHVHDEHHQHNHDAPWDGKEPHTHSHHHNSLKHSHPHYPDIHHRHDHK
ncbi:EamA family transporter [Legionella pneumophila serogroup 1]|uniref:DMT family transporter n=1 Tax=Legionella pneumophila TaxID=446 RepID=UPI0007707BCF|nr:DMT family transporter [Legionella pneumophila]MCZ4678743.1 EamA family transporter [Legionella pneumophila]MCZ4703509.1 EamA family transporter [Legionella pneumophila]MCZ4738872.1 EamA family transporter [Legionella pneumophila]MCZ4750516.1 EamA family transporter [Legionella pneumophila]MDI9827296.1 EamA family transporter [Legionella pneumophila]